MKNFIALLLCLSLVLSLSVFAWADNFIYVDGGDYDAQGANVDKTVLFLNSEQAGVVVKNGGSAANIGSVDVSPSGGKVSDLYGVYADSESSAEVNNDITIHVDTSNYGCGVFAGEGSEVTVGGDIIAEGKNACGADAYDNSSVQIAGSVTATGDGAIGAEAFDFSTIVIEGDVTGDYIGVYTEEYCTVTVGGDVTSTGDNGFAVIFGESSTVVVEGAVKGAVIFGGTSTGKTYIGENTDDMYMYETVSFLIGTDDTSDVQMGDVSAEGNVWGGMLEIQTASGKQYGYTRTARECLIIAKTGEALKLKLSSSSGKISSISGIPAGVETVTNPDGTCSLILKDANGFYGGLNKLILKLLKENPELAAQIIYYDCADYEMETVNITVSEGTPEDAVTAYGQDEHAGVTFAASYANGDGKDDVHVFNGEEELAQDEYSCYFHRDGSLSIIIDNTYMLLRGADTYNYRVIVNGFEAEFDIAAVC